MRFQASKYNQRAERIKLNLKLESNFMPYVLYNFLNFLQPFTYITKIKESNLIFIILMLNELLSDKNHRIKINKPPS